MSEQKAQPWAVGDPCPACGGALAPTRVATDAEYAASLDKENPKVLPARVDSAAPAFVAEHGTLHVCGTCNYRARVAAAAADDGADKGAGTRKKAKAPADTTTGE